MTAEEHEAALAFTYAWWLTGDDNAAQEAVLAALADPPADQGLPALLRAVRAHAAPQRTMCPASEVALLHDVHGLSLDAAAALAAVPPGEARTELAHGRLEALLESDAEPLVHPERLGGLAVGNPPDVAHARTCRSCEDARSLLRLGREEVAAIAPVPMPAALLAALPPPAPPVGPATPAQEQPAAVGSAPAPSAGTPSAPGTGGTTPAQRRGTLLLAFLVSAALLVLLLVALETSAEAAATPSMGPGTAII